MRGAYIFARRVQGPLRFPSSSSSTLAAWGAQGAANTVLNGFSRLVTMPDGTYCFLPSITGLRYLAGLGGAAVG